MKANNSKYTMFAKRVATMLVAIMMGVSAWGAGTDATINFGSASGSLNINGASVNGDDNQSNKWYVTTAGTSSFTPQSGYAQVGASKSPATSITFSTTLPARKVITTMSAKFGGFSGTAGTVTLKVGNTTIGTGSLNASTDVTVSNTIGAVGDELTITVTNISAGVKCYYISYTFETPQPHAVTFDAQTGTFDNPSALEDGNKLTEESGAEGVILPAVSPSDGSAAEGWAFYGWATSECAESTTEVPTIVGKAGERYYPADDITLHAVFAKGEYTRVTGTLTAGKYVIAFHNDVDGHNYMMTNTYTEYKVDDETYGQLAGVLLDETNTTAHKYSAASILPDYVFSIVAASSLDINTGDWMIKNVEDDKCVSVDYQNLYLALSEMSQGSDGNFITAHGDAWQVVTAFGDGEDKLYYDATENQFQTNTTASDILLYRQTSVPYYYSNPCDKLMSLTTVNTSTATLAIGASSIATCGGETSRQVTITATPATGYTFISTSKLNYTGDGTAEYVSGPTANGNDFDFIYQFSQSDNGDGEFSANASPKTYTITLNRNGGAGEAQQVTATYNSATLAAITVPEKEDCIFNGWYSEEGGNGELVISKTGALQANVTGYTGANGIWTKDAATTLYAKWTMHSFVNYRTRCCDLDVVTNLAVSATTENSVTLTWSLPAVMEGIDNFRIVKASDGSTVVDDIDKSATSATVSELTECTTYSFRVASVGGGCKNNSAIIEATPFEGAKTVTFDYNGGSGSMSEFVTACGAKTVTLPTPNDREGYTFDGWYNGSDKIGNAGEDYTPTEDIMLKAQYTEIPRHSITLKAMGSNYKTIANKLEGSSVWTLIKDEKGPRMSGYAFIGWSVSENSTTVLTSGTAGTLGADKTLHAVYQKAEYKYVKVTATSDITDGQYLIVYETGNVAFDGSLSTLDAVGNTISVDIDENEIAVSDDTEAAEFTIDATNGTVKSASGYYIGVSSNSNDLNVATSAETFPHNLYIVDGSAVVAPIFEGSSMVLRFNKSSNQNRFRYYNGSQEVIQLYKKTAILAPSTEVVVPTLTVANNQTVNADELYPDRVAGNIVVEAGGKLNVSDNLNVNNIYIESEACASGQVIGATNLHGNLYMDVTFFKGANNTLDATTAGRWYMISAPFDVNLSDGFTLTDGTAMHFGVDDNLYTFDLFEYDGKKRGETGVTGWKRAQGKMKAGTACLIGFNPGQPTTIRLKAASAVGEPESIELKEFTGDSYNQNWNGVANPTLHYTNISHDVQTYNNEDDDNGRKYNVYSASTYSFVVGTAFFVQATGSIGLEAASHSQFRAPKRESERYEACVQIFRQEATEFADQMYVRASEIASNEYEQGHDMITWNGTTGNTAMIWAENYGKRLAIEEAPLVGNQASYALGIFAPKAGTYRIAATSEDDADLYLTYEGSIIWNLSMGAYEIELNKGTTNGYGLLLQAKAPSVVTGVDEVDAETGVQKVIIDEHVFILRGGQMYDVTGKAVK